MTKAFDPEGLINLFGRDRLFVSNSYSKDNPHAPVLLNLEQFLQSKCDEARVQYEEATKKAISEESKFPQP